MIDIPKILLSKVEGFNVKAKLTTTEDGILCGINEMQAIAKELNIMAEIDVKDGDIVKANTIIAEFNGMPLDIIRGEEAFVSIVSKASGIATAAHKASVNAGKVRVVCGGWKKIATECRQTFRRAAEIGGIQTRITSPPFLYIDKNYVRLLKSIESIFEVAQLLPDHKVVIQLKGETAPIEAEALKAARFGAHIIMVDTGNIADLRKCSEALRNAGLRDGLQLSFAGGLQIEFLDEIQKEDIDVLDIGRAILDAPMLDFRYDIL